MIKGPREPSPWGPFDSALGVEEWLGRIHRPRQGGVQAKVARAGCNIGQLLSVKSRAMALGAVPVAQLRAASARTSAAVVVHAL